MVFICSFFLWNLSRLLNVRCACVLESDHGFRKLWVWNWIGDFYKELGFGHEGFLNQIRLLVMFYGAVVWDPWLIVAQIVCLQCLYYLTLGVFMAIFVGTRVSRMSLVYFFDYATVTTSTVTGWCVIASCTLSSLAGAGFLLYLIERAKKCLDFSATVYIIHLFICIIYGGWPSSITWWVVNGTGLALMALLGEYLCIRRELKEIPITRLRSSV